MSSQMVLVLLGLSCQTHTTPGSVTKEQSVLTFKPLLTSYHMGVLFRQKHHPYHHVTSITHLMKSIHWNKVIIIFDEYHRHEAELISADVRLSSMHEIFSLSVMRRHLLQLYQTFSSRLQFLVLCTHTTALELLKMVDSYDMESNRTTDFRHHSLWLVPFSTRCHEKNFQTSIHQLENVAVLCTDQNSGNGVTYRPLMSPASGPSKDSAFQDVKDIFPNTGFGLNNRTLIVSTLEDKPFIIKTKHGYEGYCVDILDSLASVLNFSYVIVHPSDRSWGQIVDGNWDGLVGQLEKREVDLVVTSLTIHEDREKVMDFLYPPIFTKVDDIAYRFQPGEESKWQTYLKPFSKTVFLFILVTFLASTLMASSMSLCNDTNTCMRWTPEEKRQMLLSFGEMLVYMYGVLLNRGLESKSRTQSLRILFFTWGIFSVIIAACYSASLVSLFAVQKPKLPFTTLEELVRQKEYKWGLRSGDIREHIFKSYRSGDMKLAWEGILQFNKTDPHVLSKQKSIHVNKMKSEKYAFVSTRDDILDFQDSDCSIKQLGQDIIWHQYGIGVPTNYPLRREIEKILITIADSGLLDIWWQRWRDNTPDICSSDDAVDPLSLQDLSAAFYILCIGVGVTGIVLLTEIIIHRMSKTTP